MKVEHPCPQCGGPVVLEEADRFFTCGFCRVSLYIFSKKFPQFYIPPPTKKMEDMIFVPYWHFRGTRFWVRDSKLEHRVFDTSLLAIEQAGLPRSLGFRTQTMKLKFVTRKTKGTFLPTASNIQETFSTIARSELFFGSVDHLLFRQFIGESLSQIYAPTYIHNGKLYDGVLSRQIAPMTAMMEEVFSQKLPQEHSSVHFAAAVCPECGWDLLSEQNSIVLFCSHCNSAWEAEAQHFKKVALLIMPSQDEALLYLPFWKISVESKGLELNTYGDFVRSTHHPQPIQTKSHQKPLYFWSPAFRLNPKLYLKLCSQMTMMQPELVHQDKMPQGVIGAVSVNVQEALESVDLTLLDNIIAKRPFCELLPEISFSLKSTTLVLVPFRHRGSELIQPEMSLCFQQGSLRF